MLKNELPTLPLCFGILYPGNYIIYIGLSAVSMWLLWGFCAVISAFCLPLQIRTSLAFPWALLSYSCAVASNDWSLVHTLSYICFASSLSCWPLPCLISHCFCVFQLTRLLYLPAPKTAQPQRPGMDAFLCSHLFQ